MDRHYIMNDIAIFTLTKYINGPYMAYGKSPFVPLAVTIYMNTNANYKGISSLFTGLCY